MNTVTKERIDKVIYTVEYFNPLGNCDNVVHVEAANEFEAALIAHPDFWSVEKEFDLSDYNVSEYDPEYIIKKEDIFKRERKGWDELYFERILNHSIDEWLNDEWKYGYSKSENGLVELRNYYKNKTGIELSLEVLKDILGIEKIF